MRWLIPFFFAAIACHAGAQTWSRSLGGQLPYEHFTQGAMGISRQAQGSLVDPNGRLLIKGDGLAIFDGATWSNYAVPEGTGVRSLAFGSNARLWVGAINQLGYFENEKGAFIFHSLLPFLSPDRRDLQDVWACAEVRGRAFFVSKDRVLAWDGVRFQEWDFPTARRLYPVRVGEELWFTHFESGLYRLTELGPQKQFVPAQLPAKPPFWAEKHSDHIIVATSVGVFRLGETTPLSGPELTDFLTQNLLVTCLRLPTGELAMATLGGVAIASPDLKSLRRVLSVRDGLPSNSIQALDLDETEHLWITTTEGGVMRTDARNSSAIYAATGQNFHSSAIEFVTATDSAILVLTQEGVSSLSLRDSDRVPEPLRAGSGRFLRVVPTEHGLALLGFNEIRLLRDNKQRVMLEMPSTTFFDLAPSRYPHRSYVLGANQLYRLDSTDGQRFDYTALQSLKHPAERMAVDGQDRVWINSPLPLVVRYDPLANVTEELRLPVSQDVAQSRGAQFVVDDDEIYLFYGREGFRSATAEYRPRSLPNLPEGACAVQVVLDARAHVIHVLIERTRPDGSRAFGLCSLPLAAEVPTWRDWYVPHLEEVGFPASLAIDPVDGHLWIGGQRGLFRVDPAALRTRPVLHPPVLTARGMEDPFAIPYEGHSLVFAAHSLDWGRRREIAFQIRMRSAREWSAWSTPGANGRFTYQNLADGEHEFAVRAVDVAGQVSAVTSFKFRVLPPTWRSQIALVVYAFTVIAVGFITLRLRERSVRRRNEELERTVAERTVELRKANAAKDDFLSSMSHEIRNPLNGVVGLAASINPATLEPHTRLKFEYLQHCAMHLSGLLEDILDFSQLEADAVTLNPQPFELSKALQAVAAITASQSVKAGRRLDIQVSPNTPRFLVGDVARIRQTIINLVINALKYGERGDVQLTVWSRQTVPERCTINFAISDEGPGIPPEELARLFNRFTRGEAARRTRASGSGIGLAISRALAEKMGGRLWAESELGHGSTFYFELPLAVALTRAEQSAALEPMPTWNALLVDDEDYNRLALESLLESVGFKFTSVSHGEAALAAAEREEFDIVFLDYDLPGQTGPEIARALRASPRFPSEAVIVAVTAFVTPEKHAECRRAGMNAVITKPITPDKLRGALTGAVRQDRAALSMDLPTEIATDPSSALRLLAKRKQSSFHRERDHFEAAISEDLLQLEEAFTRRNPRAGARAAHRLVGRLAYIQSIHSEQVARELEAALQREEWSAVDPLWSTLSAQIEVLRTRLRESQ